MEDADGGLSFDFEGGLDAPGPASHIASHSVSADNPLASTTAPNFVGGSNIGGIDAGGRRSFRQTVCRHWLRSLCMKGDACGFLHQYDKARMPVCRFFRLYGECREQDCVYKHTNDDIKECNMYKLGFCPNGPDCRYRHAKLPGPPPSVEEMLQKIQQIVSHYGAPTKFLPPKVPGANPQLEKPNFPNSQKPTGPDGTTQQPLQPPQFPLQSQIQTASGGLPYQENKPVTPLPQGISRYFIVKSCNRENLELSVQQGVWATQRSNEAKLNEAFDSAENVILVFSVNRTRHFQGCAKMTSKIGANVAGGNWKYQHGTAHYGRNFSVKWLKLCELSFHKTRHLRNPYNENLPVKISRDCQELEPSIGEHLASLLYLEPDSELMAVSVAAEAKREEEKAKGLSEETREENPDIVLFEDNEEEEEEESEEEEEVQRGRGRGMMWPPHMAMAAVRGGRPMPGMRGFAPLMMGGDGFYGQDGYGMQDMFRGYGPYGPRYPGRPAQQSPGYGGGGFGLMRAPFMGANQTRGARAAFVGPPQNSGRGTKREERNGRNGGDDDSASEGVRNTPDNSFKASSGGTESEDEAPRRSRHGHPKKKRRGSEDDAPPPSDS